MRGLLVVAGLVFGSSTLMAAPVRLCGSDWPVWELGRGMNSLGKLKDVTFSYEKYGACLDGFAANKFDAAFVTLYDFIGLQRDKQDSVIIGVTDYSSGGDVVVLRNDIASAKDLKGKTVALQADSISMFVLHLYLQSNGMTIDDVKIKSVPGENVSKEFVASKDVAAVVGWNPNLDEAISKGGKKVASSDNFKESVFDVLVVKKSSLDKDKAVYKQLLTTWYAEVGSAEVAAESAKILKVKTEEFTGWLGDAMIYKDAKAAAGAGRRMRSLVTEINNFFSKKPAGLVSKEKALFSVKTINAAGLFDLSMLE